MTELMKRSGAVDVVHLNLAPTPTLPLFRALVLALIGRIASARVILHAHSGRLPACLRSFHYRFLLRLTLRVVDVLVVVSRAAEDAVKALGGEVLHIGNGIDVEGLDVPGGDADHPSLIFVGTVCVRKGLFDLRDALLHLRAKRGLSSLPFDVVIIGDSRQEGPEAFEQVRAGYAEVGLTEVVFTGPLPRDDVMERLRGAAIFCLPSHWEGSPISLLEGMAAGCAVVATRVGDIPYIVNEGRAGLLVDPHDPKGLADAIDRLVFDSAERNRLAAAARSRVQHDFSEERVFQTVRDLYMRLGCHSRYPKPLSDSSMAPSSSGE